jgi:4-amino-4-deoxy-L-arabinose transferase-like glycosyltransferase
MPVSLDNGNNQHRAFFGGMTGKPLSRLYAFCILGVLLIALTLRIAGIGWGLPDQRHVLSYHPDEGPNLIMGALDKGVPRPHLNLGFYDYGTLYFYLWQAGNAINQTYNLVSLPPTGSPNHPVPDSPAALILVGRMLTAILGALTILPIAFTASLLFSRKAGLLAGLLWAIIPGAVMHGHYATVDMTAVFFVSLCVMYTALAARQNQKEALISYFLAALMAGLSAAVKYNCAIVLAAPLLEAARNYPSRTWTKIMVMAAISVLALTGFLFACPAPLLDPQLFLHDFVYEYMKSTQGMGLLFVHTGSGWIYHLRYSLVLSLGMPLLLLCIAGVMMEVRFPKKGSAGMLVFTGLYYVMIGSAHVRFLRYIFPILPVLLILAAGFISRCPFSSRIIRYGIRTIALISIFYALFLSCAIDNAMMRTDPRDTVIKYLAPESGKGRQIALATTPWYYTPPFSPLFTALQPDVRRQAALDVTAFHLLPPPQGTEWRQSVFAGHPEYCILSSIEMTDPLRLHLPDAERFMEILRKNYSPLEFSNPPRLFGIRINYTGYLPVDWLYANPAIYLYRRNDLQRYP